MTNKNSPSLKKALSQESGSNESSFKQNITPAFEFLTDNPKEIAKLCDIINIIATSKTGKETLEIASKAGYRLNMEFAFGSNGGTSKSKKLIVLDPFTSNDKLAGVLIHEARHAGQFERGELDSEDTTRPRNYSIKSELMKYRATEADAQATAAQALWEIWDNGDMAPFRAFASVSPEIANRFADAVSNDEKALTNGEARTQAFLGWYDNNKIKTLYEQGYTVNVMKEHQESGIESKDTYSDEITAQEIINQICRREEALAPETAEELQTLLKNQHGKQKQSISVANKNKEMTIGIDEAHRDEITASEVVRQTCLNENGKSYFTKDPEIIASSHFVDLSTSTKSFLHEYFNDFEKRTDNKGDTSYQNLDTRSDYDTNSAYKEGHSRSSAFGEISETNGNQGFTSKASQTSKIDLVNFAKMLNSVQK
ncbi:MAG: DUF6782 family putative metallopeptidase [Alphaproteobacteria bacterium]